MFANGNGHYVYVLVTINLIEEGLSKTVDWYLENQEWVVKVTSGAYQEYYETMYGGK